MSVVAHHFADEVMRELTGEQGVFSTQIAYVQAGKKVKEIGVMDMDGGNARSITKDKTIDLSPAFSPDGGRIAYTTFSRNENMEVAIVGAGGGPSKRLTMNGSVNLSPAWSPSGALTIASAAGGDDTDLYVLNMNGDLTKKLAPSYGIDVNPSWSPDGSAFVFASERAGKLHLFRADAGGGGVERLTFVGTQNDNPAWSPKGDKIAFQSLSGGWDIFIMNTDGSQIQRLTSTGNCESPTWAPNGRFIAASCGGKVVVMREDGSNATPVGPGGSHQPSWGPWVK
jgi:TolB protein